MGIALKTNWGLDDDSAPKEPRDLVKFEVADALVPPLVIHMSKHLLQIATCPLNQCALFSSF